MQGLNSVTFMGNLTKDPVVRFTPGGTAVTNLSIASNKTYKDKNGNKQEKVTYVDVTFWGKTGEVIAQYHVKGDPILVMGEIENQSWEKDGQKHYKNVIRGNEFRFLPKQRQSNNEVAYEEESHNTDSEPTDADLDNDRQGDDVADDIPL